METKQLLGWQAQELAELKQIRETARIFVRRIVSDLIKRDLEVYGCYESIAEFVKTAREKWAWAENEIEISWDMAGEDYYYSVLDFEHAERFLTDMGFRNKTAPDRLQKAIIMRCNGYALVDIGILNKLIR